MVNEWDDVYRNYKLEEIPWHSSYPEKLLIELVEKGFIKKGDVLDMCSGDGTNSIYLASKGFNVFGIDISSTAVDIANKRCRENGFSCNYLVGNVLNPNIAKKFDLVFDRGCFHHVSNKNKSRYAKILYNLLKDNGKVFLVCFSDKNKFFKSISKKEIKKYFVDFKINFIKETMHVEPSGNRVFMYSVFMEKNEKIKE